MRRRVRAALRAARLRRSNASFSRRVRQAFLAASDRRRASAVRRLLRVERVLLERFVVERFEPEEVRRPVLDRRVSQAFLAAWERVVRLRRWLLVAILYN